jgi:hypothetical protein
MRDATRDYFGLPPPSGERFHPEHIVPFSDIVLLEGFTEIRDRNEQLRIVNWPGNLVPLHPRLNVSRGSTPWSLYEGWRQFATPLVTVESMLPRVTELRRLERDNVEILREMIRDALGRQNSR